MVLKILGTGCPNCKTTYQNALKAVEELGIDASVEKVEDILKIIEYNVLGLPALVIDEKIVSKGHILSVDQVKRLIKEQEV